MNIDFSLSSIMAGLFFGTIGLFLLRRGKSDGHIANMIIGFSLMVYPYLTKGVWLDWGVGIVLCVLSYFLW